MKKKERYAASNDVSAVDPGRQDRRLSRREKLKSYSGAQLVRSPKDDIPRLVIVSTRSIHFTDFGPPSDDSEVERIRAAFSVSVFLGSQFREMPLRSESLKDLTYFQRFRE